jgi:Polysaccharide pyruvyl transferase
MKIGILTYTREYANLGTNMQCYCTFKAVQQAYPSARVEVIDYAATMPSKRPYLSNISVRSVRNDYVRFAKYDSFFMEQVTFSEEALTTADPKSALDYIRRQRYDAIYVGADTVLELKGARADSLTPFWLDGTIPSAKFLAAASSHNLTVGALSTQQKDLIKRTVDSFSLLGVRDEATFRLLGHFTQPGDERLQMVPDPTFTYDIDHTHIERYLVKKGFRPTAPVVCLHSVRGLAWAPALAKRFQKLGYIVASLRPAYYADILFTDLSPFEQMGLYKHFSLVITHRFHDTIFSLKNLTPVIAFPEYATDVTSHGESKIATLLKGFEAKETSYVSNNDALTADTLFERYPAVIAHFAKNRERLETLLREHRDRYTSFIHHSRAIVG